MRVATFHGIGALPVYTAALKGFFESRGLDVQLESTRSSNDLMTDLVKGRIVIAHGAPDNVMSWSDRTGDDIKVWLGGSAGPLALVAGAEISSPGELSGKRLGVDAVTSGFVGLLRVMLRSCDLDDDSYELVPIGATSQRFEALTKNRIDATLLGVPTLSQSIRNGYRILLSHSDVVPSYQSFSAFSLATYLESEEETIDAYLDAVLSALRWLHEPANRESAIGMVRDVYDLDEQDSAAALDSILDPVSGWPRSAGIDIDGLSAVAAIRTDTFGPSAREVNEYLDLRPLRRKILFG